MYPIMLDITNKKIVVVGGGKIALRKTLAILSADGKVTVVASNFLPEFHKLKQVTLIEKEYKAEYLKKAQLIFACTDSDYVNRQVVADASVNQWVNNCGQKELSDFFNMSTFKKNDCVIALSSYGKNPTAIKEMKESLEQMMK